MINYNGCQQGVQLGICIENGGNCRIERGHSRRPYRKRFLLPSKTQCGRIYTEIDTLSALKLTSVLDK